MIKGIKGANVKIFFQLKPASHSYQECSFMSRLKLPQIFNEYTTMNYRTEIHISIWITFCLQLEDPPKLCQKAKITPPIPWNWKPQKWSHKNHSLASCLEILVGLTFVSFLVGILTSMRNIKLGYNTIKNSHSRQRVWHLVSSGNYRSHERGLASRDWKTKVDDKERNYCFTFANDFFEDLAPLEISSQSEERHVYL